MNAGGGDDWIVLADATNNGHISGGAGYDTLSLLPAQAVFCTFPTDLFFTILNPTTANVISSWTYESIEFFRGSPSEDRFSGAGLGTRFEGGRGADHYDLFGASNIDIIDYGGEAGTLGVIVNYGLTMDAADLSWLSEEMAAALRPILGVDGWLPNNVVRDTYGEWDMAGGSFIIEGTARADFFYGSDFDDVFVGDAGDDQFFGGAGSDTIRGDAGDDTFFVGGECAAHEIAFNGVAFTITLIDGEEVDTVSGVEHIVFTDAAFTAAELRPASNTAPLALNDDNADDAVIELAVGISGDAHAAGNVLGNDEDDDNDPITVTGILAGTSGSFTSVGSSVEIDGTYGTLTIETDGSWTYELDDDRSATNRLGSGTAHDVFTYRISDGTGTATATLSVAITGSNDRPVTGAESFSTREDVALTIAAATLLSNDSDIEGAVSLLSVQDADHGTVSIVGSNVVFTPAASYFGAASFSYTIADLGGRTATQQVNVTVSSVNDAPDGIGRTVRLNEDTTYALSVADFGFTDTDGHTLRDVTIVALPAKGTLKFGTVAVTAGQVIAAAQLASLTWTPPANGYGDALASFTFSVRDTGGTANSGVDTDATPGRITFDVTGINDRPGVAVGSSARSGTLSLNEGIVSVTTATATDAEIGTVKLSLTGADAGDFVLKGGALSFASTPDYEAPRDADRNNIYKVTIVATDSGGLTRTQDLTVTIRNVAGNSVKGDGANNLLDLTHRIAGGKYATREEDRIDGKSGNDTIAAYDGNDTILGGLGRDVLTGGKGVDQFVFNTAPATANVDTIGDFVHNTDLIALDDAIFKAIGASLSSKEFYAAAGAIKAHDSDDRIIYDLRTGRLYYDDDGNKANGHVAVHIATLSGRPVIDAGDFMIV